MTTTYYARKEYIYDGGGTTFSIPSSYIDIDYIDVYINDVLTTNWTKVNATQITINAPLVTGDLISIRRNTPIDEKLVTFTDTSILSQQVQNLAQDQVFDAVQEIYDNNTAFKIDTDAKFEAFKDEIEDDIDDIQDEVDTANATANSALTNANTAITTANTASSNASSAVNTANTASANASSAVSTANTASANATSAVTTANTASATANAASDKVDEFGEDIEEVIEAAQKINELEEAVATAVAAASSASTSASTATTKATEASTAAATATTQAEEAKAKVGNLADLTTDAKTTTVAAINEVDGHCDTNATNIATNTTNIATINTELPNKLNTKQLTNCILEDPQNIKLELNNGTLTLKAGSVVCVPNGFESDGITPKFDEVTIASDVTGTRAINNQFVIFIKEGVLDMPLLSMCHSGPTAPAGIGTWAFWYDTTNNLVKYTEDGGATWTSDNIPFPFGLGTCNSTQITSLDQTFQSIGYIGSTVFVRKGLKVLIPNGRNADGSLKNIEYTTDKVFTRTYNSGTGNYYQFINETGIGSSSSSIYKYDEKLNYNFHNNTIMGCCIALGTFNVGVISNFHPYTATNILKYSDKSQISGWGMPSSRYIDLTLGASGSTYTAPANGWITVAKEATADGQEIELLINDSTGLGFKVSAFNRNSSVLTIPVQKNKPFKVNYSYGGQIWYFRFIYAEGEA